MDSSHCSLGGKKTPRSIRVFILLGGEKKGGTVVVSEIRVATRSGISKAGFGIERGAMSLLFRVSSEFVNVRPDLHNPEGGLKQDIRERPLV